MTRPAYYARPGTVTGDLISILHPPYTAWHLSYVVLGAAVAPSVDPVRLAGAVLTFAFGTGIGAHALDELHSRPLGTRMSDRTLRTLVGVGFGAALGIAVAGTIVISPLVLAWAVVGILLAAGYAAEWSTVVHSDAGFALAWGAFPALVGFWAQTETLNPAALVVAAFATLLSMVQRRLSTPARFVRRTAEGAEVRIDLADGGEVWPRAHLLATWERPLRLLSWAAVVLSIGLLLTHL